LNPVEYLWSWLKMNPMASRAIHDVEPLAATMRRSARCLQSDQPLLVDPEKGYFKRTAWSSARR
jgi:hypothetical protein